ncbi:hypothetical protein BT96DRAFT_994350 [Gymnopus androsaceus JB14]|uniref:Uncharacterized protein n=1 Tax=Gymnopus androsaceus JB14 TaxID=1447944 RepID=A0A6A4HLX6_9AGAR|nr:hypothetical protein BT96DRAFT_994350 [Gymnopus androsaceus JB14]
MSAASQFRGNPTSNINAGRKPKTGRNTAIAMGVLVAGFTGFFLSMKQRDEKRMASGNLHQYERVLSTRPSEFRLNEAQATGSDTPALASNIPRSPIRTHDAQHHARTPGWTADTEGVHAHHQLGAGGHIHQPAPQRERGDGSGAVYTKKI